MSKDTSTIEVIIFVFLIISCFRGCLHDTSTEYELGKLVKDSVNKFSGGYNDTKGH